MIKKFKIHVTYELEFNSEYYENADTEAKFIKQIKDEIQSPGFIDVLIDQDCYIVLGDEVQEVIE